MQMVNGTVAPAKLTPVTLQPPPSSALGTSQESSTDQRVFGYCHAVLQSLQGHLAEVKGLLGEPQEVTVASLDGMGSLSDWWQVFRVTQVCCPLSRIFKFYLKNWSTGSRSRTSHARKAGCVNHGKSRSICAHSIGSIECSDRKGKPRLH